MTTMKATRGARRLTRAERRAQTKAALLDAAWTVFLRRGYAGSSVEEIAAEAGYTRGAFYYNFDSLGELFVQLLQERVYSLYREMGERRLEQPAEELSLREAARELGDLQARPETRRLFRLWLELLAEAGRDENLRKLAAGFWTGTRALLTELIRRDYRARGVRLPVEAEKLATASIALDIGLALQHYVDPEHVSLDLYPDLFEALFARPETASRGRSSRKRDPAK
jgi:AcrR family transcriptional regulator